MMRKVKFQEGGMASSGISNEPVGAALRRLFERRAPMQGPPAPGGGQRPQEDRARMAAEAAPQFDEEERMLMERRRNRGSAITNQPVGERLAGRRPASRPAPMGDYEDRMQRGALPAGRSAAPGPMGEYGERAAAGATPPRPRAAPRSAAREATTAEDLNEIVLRLTRGETPVTETEKRIADRMGIAYKKGGMVNKYQEGGRVRQGIQSPRAQEARAEMAEDVMKRARRGMGEGPPRRVPNSMLTPEEQRERNAPLSKDELDRMRGDAYKKGGMVKKYRDGGNVTDSSWDEETNRRQIELGRLYDTPGMSSRGRGKVQLMEQSLPGIMHPEDTKTGAKQRALREELRQALDRGEDVEIFMDRLVRRNPQRKSFKTQEYKKGGMVKPKGHGMKEEAMEMKGGRYRGGAKEERAEMMMKKGGKVAPKKMKAGGKVAPKKMMKGGMTSKPKKMMSGGRAMYAKGGMARGCK